MVRYSKQDVLNEQERLELLAEAKKPKEELVIRTLLYTGMRASEFSNMKEHWIDWQKETIHIPKQEGDWKPKTKASIREIPISFEVKRLLYKWFQENNEIGMNRTTVFRIVKRVGHRLRPFKKVYPHSLRATFASVMAAQGMPASDIQMIMGWQKLETANNYIKSTKALETFREKMRDVR